MSEPQSSLTAERVQDLLQRKTLAAERHRHAMARLLGLSDTEVAALLHLARTGHVTPGQLGEALDMTSGGVTALTSRLMAGGRITKSPHPSDRRSLVLSATPEVIETAKECFGPLVADLDRIVSRLSEDDREIVQHFLAQVVAVSERHADALAESAKEAGASEFVANPVPGPVDAHWHP